MTGRDQPLPGEAEEAHRQPPPAWPRSEARLDAALAWRPVPRCQGVSSRRASTSTQSVTSASTMISDDAHDDLGGEVALLAVDEQVAEAADADQRADADQADARHRGDPQARR